MLTSQELGRRIADAREAAKLTQTQLGQAVGASQSAISKVESGQREVGSLMLAKVATALEVRVDDLLSDRPADELMVAARTSGDPRIGPAVRRARALLNTVSLLDDVGASTEHDGGNRPSLPAEMTESLGGAVAAARRARELLGSGDGPIRLLEESIEDAFGVYVDVAPINPVDGLLATTSAGTVIIANARTPEGRRRFTVAHELGHWFARHEDRLHIDHQVFQPAGDPVERWANKFAICLLAPPSHMEGMLGGRTVDEESALALSIEYGVSYQALLWHLQNFKLINPEDGERLRATRPSEVARRCGLQARWEGQRRDAPNQGPHSLAARAVLAYKQGLIGIGPVADALNLDDDDIKQFQRELDEDATAQPTGADDEDLVAEVPF